MKNLANSPEIVSFIKHFKKRVDLATDCSCSYAIHKQPNKIVRYIGSIGKIKNIIQQCIAQAWNDVIIEHEKKHRG